MDMNTKMRRFLNGGNFTLRLLTETYVKQGEISNQGTSEWWPTVYAELTTS
jgi:hypothetical protein